MYALSLPYAVTKIAKKFGVAFRCAAYSPGEDFELILTVKMETRYPGHYAGNPFGREFSEFVIIWELWRSEVARSGNFLSNFCVVWEIRPLMVKLSKLSFRNFTWRHRLTLLCSNVVKYFPRKIGKVLLFTAQKKSAASQTVATADIALKICQNQPPTFGSQFFKLRPNRIAFGGVIAERIKAVLLAHRVYLIIARKPSGEQLLVSFSAQCLYWSRHITIVIWAWHTKQPASSYS